MYLVWLIKYPALYFINFIPIMKFALSIPFILNLFLINSLVHSTIILLPASRISSTYIARIHNKFFFLLTLKYKQGSLINLLNPMIRKY